MHLLDARQTGYFPLVNPPHDDVATVVGRRATSTRTSVLLLLAVIGGFVVLALTTGRYQSPAFAGAIVVAGAMVGAFRPPTIVSAGGIRRPWRLRGVIGWGQVASVMSPTNGLPGVRLQLTSGKVVVLADISSEQTDVVASIGNKAVRPMAPARTAPSTAHGEPTAMDVEADVVRRARALADERRRLGMG